MSGSDDTRRSDPHRIGDIQRLIVDLGNSPPSRPAGQDRDRNGVMVHRCTDRPEWPVIQ